MTNPKDIFEELTYIIERANQMMEVLEKQDKEGSDEYQNLIELEEKMLNLRRKIRKIQN